jgi:hypothetical protein
MITAVLATILVFVVPWLIVGAYVSGVRYEGRRQAARGGFDRHAEDAVRLVREWPKP